jgi:hypothetical protein
LSNAGKGQTMPSSTPRTTKFSTTVTTIADIVALERTPYDELIPARNLYQLFEATAQLHPERPALTVMPAGDPDESAVTLSHKGLLDAITRSANLFRSLAYRRSAALSPSFAPRCPRCRRLSLARKSRASRARSTFCSTQTRSLIFFAFNQRVFANRAALSGAS